MTPKDLIERQAKLMDSLASALRAAEQSIVDFIGVTDARQHSGAHHILDEVQSALDAYRTLIDTDTLAWLEARDARMKAEGARMERDKIYRFMQHMDSEGKAYAEQILAALAQIKGKNDENN